jgi:hypothetical protein
MILLTEIERPLPETMTIRTCPIKRRYSINPVQLYYDITAYIVLYTLYAYTHSATVYSRSGIRGLLLFAILKNSLFEIVKC